MKTIYSGNNKIIFSNNKNLKSGKTYTNPTDNEFSTIINNFLKDNNTEILIKGSVKNNFSFFKKHFVNIDAAGGVVKNLSNNILLIKRLNKWDLPKGKREKNETLKTCAIREVEEECGISNVEIIKKLCPTFHIYNLSDQTILKTTHWFLMKYNGNQTLKPQNSEDISEALWLDLTKFKLEKSETYPSIIDVLNQL